MIRKITSAFWYPLRILLLFMLAPFVTIGYWFLIIFFALPSQIFRKFVASTARQLDGDLCNLVTATGTVPGRDFQDWYSQPSQSIAVIIKLKGNSVDLQHIQQYVLRNVVHKWNARKEQLEYPELQQYCTKRLGYLFFKWDRKFDISNHVKLFRSRGLIHHHHEGLVVNDEKLMEIWETCMRRPYMLKRSPWEMLVLPNYDPDRIPYTRVGDLEGIPVGKRQSVIIFRCHHSLVDGLSFYRLLLNLTDHGLDIWDNEIRSIKSDSKWMRFIFNSKAILFGPTSITSVSLRGFDIRNPLHYKQEKLTGKYRIVRSILELSTLKNIRRCHNVSLSSVLIAGITGGMRNYLLENGEKIGVLPIRMGIPVPKPGHSAKLRNEWLSSMINLPVEKKTPKERLLAVEQRLKDVNTGNLLPFLSLCMTMIGGFPVQCVRQLTGRSGITVLFSIMRGPAIPLKVFDGYSMEDILYSFGLGTDDLGIGFSAISYKGKIHLILTVDQGIFKTKEKAGQLLQLILKEIELLQYGDTTNL